jgi:hypothetical protein
MVLFQINASMPVVLPPFAAPEAALLILGLWLFVLEEKNPQLLPQTHREEEKLQLLPPPLSEMGLYFPTFRGFKPSVETLLQTLLVFRIHALKPVVQLLYAVVYSVPMTIFPMVGANISAHLQRYTPALPPVLPPALPPVLPPALPPVLPPALPPQLPRALPPQLPPALPPPLLLVYPTPVVSKQ